MGTLGARANNHSDILETYKIKNIKMTSQDILEEIRYFINRTFQLIATLIYPRLCIRKIKRLIFLFDEIKQTI
jgi:hypothetical protein